MSEHSRMDCTEVEAHLALFIGGDLEAPLAALVGAHLGACPTCGQRLAAAREARSALLGLAELEGDAGAVDLWPALRASLVSERLCQPSAAPAVPQAPSDRARARPGRLLRFARAASGVAAAALVVLLWRPWADETVDTGSSSGLAPLAGPIDKTDAPDSTPNSMPNSMTGGELDLAGLVVPAGGADVAAAEAPAPIFVESVPGFSGGLRRIGPGDELLRHLARPFPAEARRIQPMHQHGQGDWSFASGELR